MFHMSKPSNCPARSRQQAERIKCLSFAFLVCQLIAGYLLDKFFDPEDGGIAFLEASVNVRRNNPSRPRRWYSSVTAVRTSNSATGSSWYSSVSIVTITDWTVAEFVFDFQHETYFPLLHNFQGARDSIVG
jgi:hypothetical protein